ncbi:interferon-induced protein 44-like isoform X2 [Gouania willdenowi]|uniref:interferon-induced protein 44-like isoform X2 n=1 Tax=Gouania willdenowi TaxID=441366 RepID=UPI001055DA2A|nr:interferon-induced protein 44-like isoform X2 [Gouania willdenowi]
MSEPFELRKPSFNFVYNPTTTTTTSTSSRPTATAITGTSFSFGQAAFSSCASTSSNTLETEKNSAEETNTFLFPEWVKLKTPRAKFKAEQTKTQGGVQKNLHLKEKSQWRKMEWTEERKINLMKSIKSYSPDREGVNQARVLLLGPVSSGKSSFVSSVHSVFNGRVTNRAMVGSYTSGFTKKSFNIGSERGEPTGLVLCDLMGLRDGQMTGLSLHDILSVIKGHVPDGHKFHPHQPFDTQTVGYVKRPSLKDRIHCVAFVVDATKILSYPQGLRQTFHQLRKYISDLGVHQVALLTHVDRICQETNEDVSHVYKSKIVGSMMEKAGALLGMSTSYIVPVKNYSSELEVDLSTDVLLLTAADHILQYAHLYFQDSAPEDSCAKMI